MSRLCFDLSIKGRFSLLSFYVLSYNKIEVFLPAQKNVKVAKGKLMYFNFC